MADNKKEGKATVCTFVKYLKGYLYDATDYKNKLNISPNSKMKNNC